MSPRVVRLRGRGGAVPPGAVRIDRRSPWGNPFVIGRDGTREEVIERYRASLLADPALLARARQELRGRDLACWCAPLPCHGDVLLALVNDADPL